MPDNPPDLPACLTCGTCCFSLLEAYVAVTGADHARLGDAADTLVRFEGNRAYLRMVDGRCAALLLEPRSGRFVCSVYPTRPEICRALERGSPECLGELAEKRDRPLLALRRLAGP